MRLTSNNRRAGFTLVEVLVAAGLCMLIMSVLATAFALGIDTFSILKSTGEMAERLATTHEVLSHDLKHIILEDATGQPIKVSDVRYSDRFAGDPELARQAVPPAKGFFRVVQETLSTQEGNDPDSVPSTRGNHILNMSVKRLADRPANSFMTSVSSTAWNSTSTAGLTQTTEYPQPGVPMGSTLGDFGYRLQRECVIPLSGTTSGTDVGFASNWAEVLYMLKPTNVSTGGSSSQPLFTLIRRVRNLTKNDSSAHQLQWGANQAQYPNMSVSPATKLLNGPGDITNPLNRMGGLAGTRATGSLATSTPVAAPNIDHYGATTDATNNEMSGDDILLTNVLSFEIKLSWDPGSLMLFESNQLVQEFRAPPPGHEYRPSAPRPAPEPFTPVSPKRNPSTLAPIPEELPFDDLPPIPSFPANHSVPVGSGPGAQTFTYPTGTGNSTFLRALYTNSHTTLSGSVRVFDTWCSTGPFANWFSPTVPTSATSRDPNPFALPQPIRVKAIQIKVRIYDPKNKLTRQMTLVQDL